MFSLLHAETIGVHQPPCPIWVITFKSTVPTYFEFWDDIILCGIYIYHIILVFPKFIQIKITILLKFWHYLIKQT